MVSIEFQTAPNLDLLKIYRLQQCDTGQDPKRQRQSQRSHRTQQLEVGQLPSYRARHPPTDCAQLDRPHARDDEKQGIQDGYLGRVLGRPETELVQVCLQKGS